MHGIGVTVMKNKDFEKMSPEMKMFWLIGVIIGFIIFLLAGGKRR
jgi:hypothetical protein